MDLSSGKSPRRNKSHEGNVFMKSQPTIRIYRHKDCMKCERIARLHKKLDWFGKLEISTEAPSCGPLKLGEIVVEDIATKQLLRGTQALREIVLRVPLYLPFLPMLSIPFVARKVDLEMSGCDNNSCAI
jgi:hypothetical protein